MPWGEEGKGKAPSGRESAPTQSSFREVTIGEENMLLICTHCVLFDSVLEYSFAGFETSRPVLAKTGATSRLLLFKVK